VKCAKCTKTLKPNCNQKLIFQVNRCYLVWVFSKKIFNKIFFDSILFCFELLYVLSFFFLALMGTGTLKTVEHVVQIGENLQKMERHTEQTNPMSMSSR